MSRHLFVVHGPLAFLVTACTITYLGLAPESCIIAEIRENKIQPRIKKAFSSTLVRVDDAMMGAFVTPSIGLRNKIVDNFVSTIESALQGRDFHLYTFDAVTPINQVLLSNHRLQSANILEEGVANLMGQEALEKLYFRPGWRQPLWSWRQRKRFFSSGFFNAEKFQAGFFLSCEAQVGPSPKLVLSPSVTKFISEEQHWECVIVLPAAWDPEIEIKKTELHAWLEANELESVALLPHPSSTQGAWSWDDIVRSATPGTALVDPPNLVEAELREENIGLVVGWDSSVLWYAYQWGQRFKTLMKADKISSLKKTNPIFAQVLLSQLDGET